MKNVVSTALLALLLAGCATTHTDESEQPLVGYWYGEIKSDDRDTKKWVIARHLDGTYWASFDCGKQNLCKTNKEHGIWGLDNNIYWHKTMLLIDSQGPYYPQNDDQMYHLKYSLLYMSDNSIEFQDPKTEVSYYLKRVDKAFVTQFEEAKLNYIHQ